MIVLLAAATMLCSATPDIIDAVVADGDFDSPEWTIWEINPGPYSATNTTQLTSGGNPGKFVKNAVGFSNYPQFADGIAAVAGLYDNDPYEVPPQAGRFSTITFSLDERALDDEPLVFGHNILVFQDDKYFVGPQATGDFEIDEWSPRSRTGIVEEDFIEIDIESLEIVSVNSHPTFDDVEQDATFGFIWFGYLDDGAVSAGSLDLDNFEVEIWRHGDPETFHFEPLRLLAEKQGLQSIGAFWGGRGRLTSRFK